MLKPMRPGDLESMDQDTGDSTEEVTKESLEQQWYRDYKTKPYKELAAKMVDLKKQIAELERTSTLLASEFDVIRLRVIPERFAEDSMTSLRIEGIGRLGLTRDAYCDQVKDKQEDLFNLLREIGSGDLIKETVNPSSLKSLVKDLHADHMSKEVEFDPETGEVHQEVDPETGEPVKDEFERISECVVYTPFMRASVTKG